MPTRYSKGQSTGSMSHPHADDPCCLWPQVHRINGTTLPKPPTIDPPNLAALEELPLLPVASVPAGNAIPTPIELCVSSKHPCVPVISWGA